ncbi:MAG: hypothetical protein QNJ72_01815 [Pleurocapsa sp. MO_226.B13]|nr:hypothetical protein [Pleurocapsa sp. MO_226.B13]
MQHQKSRSINISDREYYKNHVPQKPILTSHDAGWQNLVFEHHRQPPYEKPEVIFQQHVLVLSLKKISVEIKMDDHFEAVDTQMGDIVLIPKGVDHWSADRTRSEFLLLAIAPRANASKFCKPYVARLSNFSYKSK